MESAEHWYSWWVSTDVAVPVMWAHGASNCVTREATAPTHPTQSSTFRCLWLFWKQSSGTDWILSYRKCDDAREDGNVWIFQLMNWRTAWSVVVVSYRAQLSFGLRTTRLCDFYMLTRQGNLCSLRVAIFWRFRQHQIGWFRSKCNSPGVEIIVILR